MEHFDQIIDATGLACPLPILRARKALAEMKAGEILFIKTTDPDSIEDFKIYTNRAGHGLLSVNQKDGVIELVIRNGEQR